MGALLIYLMKSSLMLALSVVLFMLLMRRETFHGINRVLLLAVVLLSLLLPAVEWEVDTPMAHIMGSVEQMVISADATVAVGQPLAVAVDAGEQTGMLHYVNISCRCAAACRTPYIHVHTGGLPGAEG